MKKWIITKIFLSSLGGVAFAQFSPKTEYLYLQHINAQGRKDLIRDNLSGAEIAGLLFINQAEDRYHGLFFDALAQSYTLVNQPTVALYHSLVQRCLYPSDSLARRQELFFRELLYALNLSDSAAASVVARTTAGNLPASRTGRIALALELGTRYGGPKITQHIFSLGQKLRENNAVPPVWYQHWEFLTQIGITERHKKAFISYTDTLAVPVYQRGEMPKRLKVYRKAIRYYLGQHARSHARELAKEYKNLPLRLKDKACFIPLSVRLNRR